MKGNRGFDTAAELRLRHALFQRGHRYRKEYRIVTPSQSCRVDIAFVKRRLAVFVDGCFWHGCPAHGRVPRTNDAYWRPKLQRNVERDRANDAALRAAGWTVVRLWEHAPVDDGVATVEAALAGFD
jgi:DNA mismatch endonuclease (patch repair protein)